MDAPMNGIGRRGSVDAEVGERADLGVVGERCGGRDAGVRGEARAQSVDPAGGRDRVGIEQHHVVARTRHGGVDGADETEVAGLHDDVGAQR